MKNILKKILATAFLIFIIGGFVIYERYSDLFHNLIDYMKIHPFLGYVLFILFYAATVLVITIPEWPFIVTLGMFIDFWTGTILVVLGGIIGAMLAFVLGRYFFREEFHKRICHTKLGEWVHINNQKKLIFLAVIARIIPIVPNNLANYAFALTKIKPLNYFISTSLSIIPCVMLFIYAGNKISAYLSPKMIFIYTIIFVIAMTLYLFKDKLFGKINKVKSGK